MRNRNILLMCLFLLGTTQLSAVSAIPTPVKKTQPDGTEITVRLRGDEKIHWMETLDGHTLMYDANKYIVYATTDADGNMTPSAVKYMGDSGTSQNAVAGLKKGLRYSPSQIKGLLQIWEVTDGAQQQAAAQTAPQAAAPVTGTKKALCVLMEFSDKSFTKAKADFETLFNQEGLYNATTNGSVRDFYRENSYGQLDLTVTVVGPYKATNTTTYYATHQQEFARLAAQAADADVNYTEFAVSGQLQTFHIIFAGYGDEVINNGKQIWSHKWQLTTTLTLDGVKISVYSCSPELRNSSGSNITYVGVICHELCHVFGAPDYYDTNTDNGEFLGTGKWDLMADGSWNDNGRTPAHINMFQKILYGWVTPEELTSSKSVVNMPNSVEHPVAYTIKAHTSGEMYVLENRQKVKFDAFVPGTGLLIYHVHASALGGNGSNNGHPQQLYPVCASATSQIPSSAITSYGSINSSGCPFPGTSNKSSFTDNTTPMAFSWTTSSGINKPITYITESGGSVSFEFMKEFKLVTNLQAVVTGSSVTLTWLPQYEAIELAGFKIYRDDNLIYTISDTTKKSFTQAGLANKTYNYCVTAMYAGNNESRQTCKSVTVSNGNTVTCNPVTNLHYELIHETIVSLAWTAPTGSPVAYNIYRDNAVIAASTTTSYTDETADKNTTYSYYVTAKYSNNCESEQTGVEVITGEVPELAAIAINGEGMEIDEESRTFYYVADCGEQQIALNITHTGTLTIKSGVSTYTPTEPIFLNSERTRIDLTIATRSGSLTYTIYVARALGDATTPMYIQRWGKVLSVINNSKNNGGYTFDDYRWYRVNDNNTVVATDGYIIYTDSYTNYYAEAHNTASNEWHKLCGSVANQSSDEIVTYPNPVAAGQSLSLSLPEGVNNVTVRIYDINGRMVRQQGNVRNSITAPVQTGVFLLQIILPDGSINIQKIIVN